MLGKTEVKVGRPRGDGRHCDLCGCSFPAVRCDKCGSQIFCLSCDDMYHRHPKRRFHLRKAVDPTPTPQARPVLPMKVSQLASTPGDPSKMPLPPPRKKKPGKSFFDSFRRGSPSSDNSPPLPKKEYSWSDRLGSIKKFMSNRPLPPLPKDEDNQEEKSSPPMLRKNDLSFIHKRVDEKPPQLPHRTQAKSPSRKLSEGDLVSMNQGSHLPDKQPDWTSNFGAPTNNFQQTPVVPPTPHLNGQVSRDSSESDFSAGRFRSKSLQDDMSPTGLPNFPDQPNLSPTMPPDVRGYSTLKRPSAQGQDLHNQSFMSMPGNHFPGMHTSSSVTDLHTLDSPSARGPQQFPNFPMPPHYPHPYPMYPHYPNYPQYFGTSFANLSTALPNIDGDFSDHSDASSFSGKKHPKHSGFGIKAKRSQSVMYDRMAYPPQYYPFGGFPPHPPLPGYGAAPWGQSDHPVEAPSSPATSVRSFGRSHRSRHRKKKMVASDHDDEDERLSVRSSPRSRTTSSSDRLRKRKTPKKFERSMSPSSLTSSEEEEENQAKEDRLSPEIPTEFSQGDGYQTKQDKKKVSKQMKDAAKSEHKTKQYGSKMRATSHQKLKTDDKNFSPKFKMKEKAPLSSSESMDVNEEQEEAPKKTEEHVQAQQDAEMREESDYHSEEDVKEEVQMEEPRIESTLSEDQWQCEHCTFINSTGHRICQVCCKTKPGCVPQSDPVTLLVPEMQASSSAAASPILNTTSESLTSDTAKEYLTPPPTIEDDRNSAHSENEGQNLSKLNSDLEQAEKELSRGLMELMKLKEETDIANSAQTVNRRLSDNVPPADREVITIPNTQTGPEPAVPEIDTIFPQLNNKVEASNEQMSHQPNVPKVESVSSKSIGTDSMDFDFPTHQTQADENITGPAAKPMNFGLFTQDHISPENSFSEITSSAPSSQKDTSGKPPLRRDSSCQTYQDSSGTQIENEVFPLPHAENMEFQHPYNRADSMRSPQLPPIGPSGYRGFSGRGQGLMHRSHSRSSLFGDRYGDARNVPPEFDNLGFGFGPSPMYRSLSRSSLTGDYSDPWMSEVRSLRRPDFYLSMEELVERRRLETKRAQGLELVRMIREAEQQGFTADDIHVALNNCGKQNPVDWLQTNWRGMVDTVVTLATNYGKDKHENDIGVLSENEARDALRMHKGNIWAAVTECVEGRQRKFLELRARGNFCTKEIVDALTQSEGNVELAYTRMSATTLKPFLMRIWGTGEGVENQDGAVCDPAEFLDPESSGWPKNSTLRARNVPYGDAERCSDQEDWDDDDDVEEEVSWNEDEEEEVESPENFDIEPQIINREKRPIASHNIATPESDSEYCDAFDPVGDARSATSSSPVDEIFFVSPDSDTELQKDKKKGTSFLSRLAALRKNKKPQVEEVTGREGNYMEKTQNYGTNSSDSLAASETSERAEVKIKSSDSNSSNSETSKIYSPLNILKQTFSAIKDTVIGSNNKNELKHARSITEARTIIVHDRDVQETLPLDDNTQKNNKRELNGKPSPRIEHTEKDIRQVADESGSKEKDLVHASENSKGSSVRKGLTATSAVMANDKIPGVSTSSEKEPVVKHQSDEHFVPEVKTTADTANILNNTQNTLSSVSSGNKSEDTSHAVIKNPPINSTEVGTMKTDKPLTLVALNQPRDNRIWENLEDDMKGSSSITVQSISEKSIDKLFQEKHIIVPDKGADDANNIDSGHPQAPAHEPTAKAPSEQMDLKDKTDNGSERNNLLEKVPANVIATNDVPVTSVVKETIKSLDVTLVKTSDSKPKMKKQREGLRLKIPGLEKKANSEIPEPKTKPDGKKDPPLIKADVSPKADVHLDEKQKPSKTENHKAAANSTESQPVPEEQSNKSQKAQGGGSSHAGELLLGKSAVAASSEISMSEKSEAKGITNEKSEPNISENEFHDMASKITEKMENCLEVLKSSEAVFSEINQNTGLISEKDQKVLIANEAMQVKTNSLYPNAEAAKENVDNTITDVSEVPSDREEGKNDKADAKSPSPALNLNRKLHADDTITEISASPVKDGSTDEGNHALPRPKTLEKPSASNAISDENADNTVASNSISDKSLENSASVANAESPAIQKTPSSPTTINVDNSAEVPVVFSGVKAKTFTGVNKKAKSKLFGSDKKQNDISVTSPTPKTAPKTEVTLSDKVSADEKDSLDEKQMQINNTDIDGDVHVIQPRQDETEQHVHSISSKGETVSSASIVQSSETVPDGIKNKSPFHVQTELKETGSDKLASSETLHTSKQAEEGTPELQVTMNTVVAEGAEGRSEAKLELVDANRQEKEKDEKNVLAVAKKEAQGFASNRFLEKKTKEQDSKTTTAVTKNESLVPTSSRSWGIKSKEQDNKTATSVSNSETSGSSSSRSWSFKAKEKDTKASTATTSSETSVSASIQDLDTKAKEKNVENAATTSGIEGLASTSSKDSDIKAKEQYDIKGTIAADTEASVLVLSNDSDAKENNQDIKQATAASDSEASVSSKADKLSGEIQEATENSHMKEDSVPSSPVTFGDKRPTSRVDALKNSFNDGREGSQGRSQSPLRPQSPFGRMTSLSARKEAIAQERNKEVKNTPTTEKKPWFIEKVQPPKPSFPKRSIKQQLEFERKIRNLVSERKCRTYRKAEIVVQLLEMKFSEEEALQAAHECSTLEQAISYLQQECLLCTGMYPVGQIVSMIHCPHKACKECIKAYFTIQIRDRTIMELLCPFCNEPDISDEDVAQDYFNHLDILLKKLVESDIHELFQRKLRDRVLMKDPNFRWCSQCSSGFIAMPDLKRLICPDCNAITCASCRRPWEREHEGISCEAFAAWKDANDPEAHTAGLAKLLQEDGIDCPNCHFRYSLAKGGCMHFRCMQCQHDFCSGCSRPFKMGQKCGVSEFCVKLGLHAHHPRNCLFYLRDKDPEDLQKLLDLNEIDYDKDPPDGMELKFTCQVMEQKETSDGLVDDICGKEVQESQAGLCRVHYVEYLGQLVNKHKIDPIQIFCNDDLELVLRRASKRLPAKGYRDSEIKYREKLVQLIQEELPLELTEGS